MTEIWKEIPGYDGYYEVSNMGRVRSWKIGNGHPGKISEPRTLKKSLSTRGYYILNLCRDGKIKTTRIHRLVAKAFIPNPKNKPQINHIDGDKLNNLVTNLEWVTNKENSIHAHGMGLTCNAGEDHGYSKLKEREILRIRYLYSEGELQRDIADLFNITQGHVSEIVNNKIWTHI